MKKYVLLLLLILSLTSKVIAPQSTFNDDSMQYLMCKQHERYQNEQLKQFLEVMAYTESANNYKAYNKFGYLGKYQFGPAAREITGFDWVTYKLFISNPEIWTERQQDSAMLVLMKINEQHLNSIISLYNDSIINDIRISKSGILAAAHLAGYTNVRKYFETNGKRNPRDAYGTTLSDYLSRFSAYDF